MDSVDDLLAARRPSRRGIVLAGLGGGVAGLLGGLLLGWVLGGSGGTAPAQGVPSASAAPEPVTSASAAPPTPAEDPAEKAARGDAEALKLLEAKALAERSVEEQSAVALARRHAKLQEIAELERKIRLLPKIVADKSYAKRLESLAYDREVSTETLRMIAGLPGPTGPDLLYSLWTGTTRRTESTELAEQFLALGEVRARASPALLAVLDLRAVERCEDLVPVLSRVKEHGDRRALVPLVRFYNRFGCGEKQRDDCWACIRKLDPDPLKEAATEAQKRKAP